MVISSQMNQLKRARQLLKAISDDTRLRIVNLLSEQELNVSGICDILKKNQSVVSKHLARLRHAGVVSDRREGMHVFYFLIKSRTDPIQNAVLPIAKKGLQNLEIFREDLKQMKRKMRRIKR